MKKTLNAKEFDDQCRLIDIEDEKIVNNYYRKGFIKDKRDEEGLHMSFSPYRVKKGLTKLQIRRRINNYFKHKYDETSSKGIIGNRLEITINGKSILGGSFLGKVPENTKELTKLLKELVKMR